MGSRRSHVSPRPLPGRVPGSIWGVLGGPWAVLGSLRDVLGARRGSQGGSALVSSALGGVINRMWSVFENVKQNCFLLRKPQSSNDKIAMFIFFLRVDSLF